MQIVKQNIKRPALFEEFFNHLLTWSNDVIDYISITQKEPKAITPTYLRIIQKTSIYFSQTSSTFPMDCIMTVKTRLSNLTREMNKLRKEYREQLNFIGAKSPYAVYLWNEMRKLGRERDYIRSNREVFNHG